MGVNPRKSADSDKTVAIALDDHMVYAFFVLVHSLAATARESFSLVIGHFTGRLSPANISLMTAFLDGQQLDYEIRELTPHPLFTERRHLTITTFSKFVISDAIPTPHLWIDIDTVARTGWDDIFSDINSATSDVPLVVAAKIKSPHTRFEGFNAGVLGWTQAPRKEWVQELANLPEKRFSSEQHLFNTLYRDNNQVVDARFNFLSSWHDNDVQRERASIAHFSGPLKPWHLPRRHRRAWLTINPTWEMWFHAEDGMLSSLASSLQQPVARLKKDALTSGRLHTGKGALAGWFFRFLVFAGPLGNPLVELLRRRSTR